MQMVPPSNHDRAPLVGDKPLGLPLVRLTIVLAVAGCCINTGVRSRAGWLHRLFGSQIMLPMNVGFWAVILDQRPTSNGWSLPIGGPVAVFSASPPKSNDLGCSDL